MGNAPKHERLNAVLERNHWFSRRPADLRRRLIAHAQVSTVEAGHWLYDAGDEARGLYGVLSGSVTTFMALDGGEDVPVNIAGPGSIFGYAAQVLGGHRVTTVVTREHTEVIFVPQHALAAIARDVPSLWLHFAEMATEQLVMMTKAFAEHLRLPPEARLASRLHAYASVWDKKDGVTTLPIRQDELAELTGLSRKTVNLILRDFEKDGLITSGYRAIHVLDVKRLQEIVTDCSA